MNLPKSIVSTNCLLRRRKISSRCARSSRGMVVRSSHVVGSTNGPSAGGHADGGVGCCCCGGGTGLIGGKVSNMFDGMPV